MTMDSLQHGWLYIQAGILKRWKKKWFNLSHHGSLTICPRPYSQPDDMLDLTSECSKILFAGAECSGKIKKRRRQKENPDFLIYIICDVTTLMLMASTEEEFMDWKTALKLVTFKSTDSWMNVKESQANEKDCPTADNGSDAKSQNITPALPTARQQIESMYCKRMER